jgi:site-specific recombinase XerD
VALTQLKRLNGNTSRVCRRDQFEKKWFRECVRAAGIADFRWHDCRHTFATRFLRAGVDLYPIKELLGHKTVAMTARYARLDRPQLRAAVHKLDSLVTTSVTTGDSGAEGQKGYVQ